MPSATECAWRRPVHDEVVAVVRDVTDLRQAMRDLTESRARIVAAGDAERRRVERNLHDGAQQRLVTVALHLHLLRRKLETAPAEAPELVESAQTELALALEEIRELVRGLHPRLLSDRGLEPALAGLAERALLPVEIVETPSERLPPAVEAAACYLVAEALANAAKHSQASRVTVRVSANGACTASRSPTTASAAPTQSGSGLRGLSDRVAALGGELEVASEPGGDTPRRAAARPAEPVAPLRRMNGEEAHNARSAAQPFPREVGHGSDTRPERRPAGGNRLPAGRDRRLHPASPRTSTRGWSSPATTAPPSCSASSR